jgi:outer membrane protein
VSVYRLWLIAAVSGCLLSVLPQKVLAQETPQTNTLPVAAKRKPERTLTLAQAEALALKNNPQITIGKLQALVAHQQVRETRSSLLPTATLNLTGVEADPGSRLSAGLINSPALYSRAATGANVSQLVTDFGRTTNLLASSEYQAKAQDQNAAATAAQIVLAVDQAFYNVLETKALETVAEQTVGSRQVLVDQIRALTNAKLKSDLDLSFTTVDLARGKLLLLESQNNYESALAVLSAILGFRDEQNFQPVDEAAAANPPAPEVSSLIAKALEQRPEVAALQDEVRAAEKFGGAEHDLWRPTISALGSVGLAPVRDDHISSWYGAVGVNIGIPIFNGFLYNARAKTADLQTEVTRQKLVDLQDNIARDVRIAWQDTNRAYERLSVTQQLKEQASLAYDLAQARYNLGLGSIVEFSQADLQRTEADITDTDARYQYRLTQIVLAFTVASPK